MIDLSPGQVTAIVREAYERIGGESYRPKRLRVALKTCPRGNVPSGALPCSGVLVGGVRVVDPHGAPSTDFGHDAARCRRGSARCSASRCRRCHSLAENLNKAVRRARLEGMRDYEIRRAKPRKRCGRCGAVKDSMDFAVFRTTVDGLFAYCRSCAVEVSRSTTDPETIRAASRRRRAAKSGADSDGWTDADLYAKHANAEIWGCAVCETPFGTPGISWERDHSWPLALGGTDTIDNVWFLCSDCHATKIARDPWSWVSDRLRELGNDVAADMVALTSEELPIETWVRHGRARYKAAVAAYEKSRENAK